MTRPILSAFAAFATLVFGAAHADAQSASAVSRLAGAPAQASQAPLASAQVFTGYLDYNRYQCHTLATMPGTQWRVSLNGSMDTVLHVGRGSCDAFTADLTNDDQFGGFNRNSRIDFAAGGGVYIIKAEGYGGAAGSYSLRIEQRPGLATRGLLPAAGAAGPWLTPGWTPASVTGEPANAGEGLTTGNVFKDCADVCPEMVVIPAGSFTMGSPAEEAGRTSAEGPRHPVALIHAFAIGRYEVTFAEYDACVADGGCAHAANDQGWGRGRRPVVDVNWDDAQAYVAWLSQKTGHRYQLPSEAEWEYAARAGSNDPWQTGPAILTDDANILNAFAKTVNVGGYPPNAFGLNDIHGNVLEWTLDCMDTGYIGVPNDGAAATSGDCPAARVTRGGSFVDEPAMVRFAARKTTAQLTRGANLGFRVARAL